ncbi:MAG: ATP-binding protein [Oscillibacter sp.]
MTKRIFRSILTVSLAVLLASLVLIVGVLHGYFQSRMAQELSAQTAYIAQGVEKDGMDYLNGLDDGTRITWVAGDGRVLYDNWERATDMENHADRAEIQQALRTGRGSAVRWSATLSQNALYVALRLDDGSVLRTADTRYSVWLVVLQALQPMLFVVILACVLALFLASRVAKQLMAPINAIDLAQPAEPRDYEELAPLLGRIRSQNRQIERQMGELRRQQAEFAAITENMSEGFLVLDAKTNVLSYNTAALRLLGAQTPGEEPCSAYALNRESGFRRCVEEALAGRRWEEMLEREEDCRQILASPVEREGHISGAVLVLLDVTEKARREQLRREFTANVSHELKTPLTSILGTAEILENGLIQPADLPHFAENLHREAERLIKLVNDIIKLSRLDEGGPAAEWESVELFALAGRVLEQVRPAAQSRHITLELAGETAFARGVPAIVEEILFNLCDNAVAYNRDGGSVHVTVEPTALGASVTVADSGIGIPREAQSRVFERFYRVEKSHSAPGTGLGLSIVKHGCAYLGAQVKLESQPGKGSTFTLQFPPEP